MFVGIIFKVGPFVSFGLCFFFPKNFQSLRFRPAAWNGVLSHALSPETAISRLQLIAAGVWFSPISSSVNNCPFHHLQLCLAACLAHPSTEVCSPLITPSAHGWPTSATAAIGSPPKSWRPQSASQTAPGATTTRYPDAAVRNWWGEEAGGWRRRRGRSDLGKQFKSISLGSSEEKMLTRKSPILLF